MSEHTRALDEYTRALDLIARRAYEAYTESLGINKTPNYKTWEKLPEHRQKAWRYVIKTIIKEGS